ncbi:MAG TPA: hypothetical protein VN776_08315, partial [Terracidiphilus sp.]|nr:hypothetical protein [Terracidiphilus sp.]
MSVEHNRLRPQNGFNIELDAIRAQVSSINERLDALRGGPDSCEKSPGLAQEASQALFESILVRLDCLQESVVLNRRLSAF